MPLRDHFRSPLINKRRWDAVHGAWPVMIVRSLFDILPQGFVAEPNIHLGPGVEVDVGTHRDDSIPAPEGYGRTAAVAVPQPTFTLEADLSEQDEYEVRVYDMERDQQLVAAIEIISPSNKDRPESRQAFVAKAAALLKKDVSVSIVDVVTVRQFNLCAELLEWIGQPDPEDLDASSWIYAATLRPRKSRQNKSKVDVWFYPMVIGQPLPTLPICLGLAPDVLLPLESSYEETCRLLRIA